MAGFGASALSLDGQCVDPAAPDGTCDTIHNTGPVGGGLLGAGLAIAAGGVVLLAVPGPRRPVPVQVQVQVPGHVDGSNEGPELPTPGREATERASR